MSNATHYVRLRLRAPCAVVALNGAVTAGEHPKISGRVLCRGKNVFIQNHHDADFRFENAGGGENNQRLFLQ